VVVAYALSPIDLIPDFVPILGYLDDLVLIPLGVVVAVKLVPPDVLADSRRRAEAELAQRPRSWLGAAAIMAVWLSVAVVIGVALASRLDG
jgi:uncharacterized membrane protein YkvA (DUF1232 family)